MWDTISPTTKTKRFSQNGVGMIQNLFLLSRNSAVEFFSDTEAVIGSNPIVTTKKIVGSMITEGILISIPQVKRCPANLTS